MSASPKTIHENGHDEITTMYENARRTWPGVKLEPAVFLAAVEELRASGVALAAIHAEDLYLARACLMDAPGAARALDMLFLAHVGGFVRRIDRSALFADDVRQALREHLLVPSRGRAPRIADYVARGPLLAWIRVAAVRTALNMRRAASVSSRTRGFEDDAHAEDPERAVMARQHERAFAQALADAIEMLHANERAALRLAGTGLSTAKIGELLEVNQSTIARRLANARVHVRERARTLLEERLRLSGSEADALARTLARRADVELVAS